MITYVRTSIFDSPAQTWVNAVNTVGVMGKGLAKAFKDRYPAMFQQYRYECEQRQLDIGRLSIYRSPDTIIVNFPTKKHWKNPSQVDYIEEGLRTFVAIYQHEGITSVSFPQLGCGNGGLDWSSEVRPLMERYLQPLPIPVYVHEV